MKRREVQSVGHNHTIGCLFRPKSQTLGLAVQVVHCTFRGCKFWRSEIWMHHQIWVLCPQTFPFNPNFALFFFSKLQNSLGGPRISAVKPSFIAHSSYFLPPVWALSIPSVYRPSVSFNLAFARKCHWVQNMSPSTASHTIPDK